MGYYTKKLTDAKKRYDELYNKETAFGDEELIKLTETIAGLTIDLENNRECAECDGYGDVECHCCNNTSTCKDCHGTGLIPNP